MRSLVAMLLLGFSALSASAADVWVEAEDFAEKGDWVVDTQFTHVMGSAYLLCPGANRPTERQATTTVDVPAAGNWTAWVRTKDWLPEFSPGKFALVVDGRESGVLGTSKRAGWRWEKAGVFPLKSGKCTLALKDLSGAYARCDAVLLTDDAAYRPPDEAEALGRERSRLSGVGLDVAEGGTFDVVVVGAGPGGMGASLAAARTGASVGLVFDRPIAGGNASPECGIDFDGASLSHKNARESGLVEELRLTKAYRQTSYTEAFGEMARHSPSLKMFANERVMRVETNGAAIAAVVSRNTRTGRWTRWCAKMFVDSTGDGWIARFAGARTMYGREAGGEFGEEWIAPKTRDTLTMSGKVTWRGGRDMGKAVRYETPVWARIMPKGFDRKVLNPWPPWWLEAPGRVDDVEDPEAARDHLVRISFAYWGWLKNDWENRDRIKNWEIVPPVGFNGRREGFRVVGDYVLTANDCRAGRMFDDRVSYGGWSLDTHDPLGMDNPHGDGWWHPHMCVPIYSVPYRMLYSADVPNLFLGSRCESMTHIALGSMRVQGTQMAVGQAVGTAAALCLRKGVDARTLGQAHIVELQQQLLKDDQYIPDLLPDVPLSRECTASATSSTPEGPAGGAIDGVARQVGDEVHGWVSDPTRPLPQALTLTWERPISINEIRLVFDSDLTPMRVKARMPAKLVKSYRLEGCAGGRWTALAEENENFLRHRIHRFATRSLSAVRIVVTATWGDPSARIYEVKAFSVDESAALKASRKMVWSDEFEGNELDPKKWCFRASMNSTDCLYVNDARTYEVKDSKLCLHVRPSPDPAKRCLLPRGVATHETMAFKYGYLEMRAKVPFRHGAWPSFWMTVPKQHQKCKWMSEVDIFEVFSSSNTVVANLHKWGWNDKAKKHDHVMLPGGEGYSQEERGYRFPNAAKLNGEFHVYGYEWTPLAMSFFVDGMRYCTIPIDEAHDYSPKPLKGMAGHHDFHSVIFNNEVFTPGHGWMPKGAELKPEDLPIDYEIDWIRLYQRDGEEIRL